MTSAKKRDKVSIAITSSKQFAVDDSIVILFISIC